MNTTKYKIIKDVWWDSNGCSCCEPTPMPYYQVFLEKEDGSLVDTEISMSSLEDVYEVIMGMHNITVEVGYSDEV